MRLASFTGNRGRAPIATLTTVPLQLVSGRSCAAFTYNAPQIALVLPPVDNSQLAVVTRWEQDLTRDSSGRFLYVRDVDTG